jgi:hypothetical protein
MSDPVDVETSIMRAALEAFPLEEPPAEAPVFELLLLPPRPPESEPSEQATHKRRRQIPKMSLQNFIVGLGVPKLRLLSLAIEKDHD